MYECITLHKKNLLNFVVKLGIEYINEYNFFYQFYYLFSVENAALYCIITTKDPYYGTVDVNWDIT